MVASEEFKKIVKEDIKKCSLEIENGNKASRKKVHDQLSAKYGKIVDGFNDGLKSLFYDDEGIYCLQNIETMREKLLLFEAMNYKNLYSSGEKGITIHNTNQQNTTIDVTFEKVREQVSSMGALTEEQIEEIQEKINVLERIIQSDEQKTKKWSRAREILKWVADKGVDVGVALLPLFLQIQ